VVAAGARWFMALFGRDSLLTSWMLLPWDDTLAAGTLQTLAERQGHVVDPATEEEPDRILHEVRQRVPGQATLTEPRRRAAGHRPPAVSPAAAGSTSWLRPGGSTARASSSAPADT
jgi:hypothetical protein